VSIAARQDTAPDDPRRRGSRGWGRRRKTLEKTQKHEDAKEYVTAHPSRRTIPKARRQADPQYKKVFCFFSPEKKDLLS
jgi:hypothetical protein